MSESLPGFWAVVPAGGAGTRLWPLSRRTSPKFLHDLTGSGRTLLQQTRDRLSPLAAERIVVVTGVAHAAAVAGQLHDLPARQVLAEPSPRDSMPAIALAAAFVERWDPQAVIGSFAADHVIADVDAFHACVREAVAVARSGLIVTLGITPTHPATGFGYIRTGRPLAGFDSACQVVEFVEKPDAPTATRYVDSGGYLWNAGMFVAGATVLLDALAAYHPALAEGARAIAAAPERLGEIWPTLTKIAIDHAVAEPGAADGLVAVVPATFPWDDVGDFASLGALLPHDGSGMTVLGDGDQVVVIDGASGLVAARGGRLVAVVGVEDIVVVDTPDAVLVVPAARAQQVKAVVEELTRRGRTDLT